MAYTFKQVWLPISKYSIKSPFTMTPQFVTVHNTANDASAANEIAYHNRNNNQVSFHVAVDDKEVIQCIPFTRNAWHCGDGKGNGNMKSIGIEICYSKSGGTRYIEAEENAVQYIAQLLIQYGWGINRVKQHHDWSGKNCPHRIRAEGRWQAFLKRIDDAMKPVIVESPKKDLKDAVKESEEIMLTETGREEIRALMRKARNKIQVVNGKEEPVINPTIHTDAKINQYTDVQLLSYQAAVINRTFV